MHPVLLVLSVGWVFRQVFNELEGNTWSSLAKLRACIGDVASDVDNPLLETEMKRQRGSADTGEVIRALRSTLPDISTLHHAC